jgi:ABC-type taurine transport system ATPase subunit
MIREIVLRRFKRFDEERFDLNGHVILAGPNNCGKTTVLQAIAAWALGLRRWRELNDFQRHGGAYTKAPMARQAFSAVPLRSYEFLWKDRNYSGVLEIEALLAQGQRVTMEFHKDSTEQVYVRPKNDVEPEVVRDLNLDVVYVATLGGLSTREFKLDPEAIETLLGEQKPGEVVRNLLLQVSMGNLWQRVTESVERLFGVELLAPQAVGGQIICEYRQSAAHPQFDLMNAGAGMQQVVMLLACLFWRRGSMVLVDEPDAHLHVFLQDTIFAELKKAAAETNSQLVIATHSEAIFNSADPGQICVMMGRARRLTSGIDLQRLRQAVTVLQQSDLVAALAAPGILYLEGYTDLNLLREWARKLAHPLSGYLDRTPYWHPVIWNLGDQSRGIKANEHFSALQLVKEGITGIWLLDADGKTRVPTSNAPEPGRLNRLAWSRYETESYLIHPQVLSRFIEKITGTSAVEVVDTFFTKLFGEDFSHQFTANPFVPPPLVDNYLKTTKARTVIVGALLTSAGIRGFDYTRFDEIASVMRPEEIHPEIVEKLNFIQQAFGL